MTRPHGLTAPREATVVVYDEVASLGSITILEHRHGILWVSVRAADECIRPHLSTARFLANILQHREARVLAIPQSSVAGKMDVTMGVYDAACYESIANCDLAIAQTNGQRT